eukprot:snap_masked-scaffold_20-processed-gene-3.21-mRNA-1 protein AED:1.00 eAED:1.00 QI:0/-1/0/0/-1/1/1/0/560
MIVLLLFSFVALVVSKLNIFLVDNVDTIKESVPLRSKRFFSVLSGIQKISNLLSEETEIVNFRSELNHINMENIFRSLATKNTFFGSENFIFSEDYLISFSLLSILSKLAVLHVNDKYLFLPLNWQAKLNTSADGNLRDPNIYFNSTNFILTNSSDLFSNKSVSFFQEHGLLSKKSTETQISFFYYADLLREIAKKSKKGLQTFFSAKEYKICLQTFQQHPYFLNCKLRATLNKETHYEIYGFYFHITSLNYENRNFLPLNQVQRFDYSNLAQGNIDVSSKKTDKIKLLFAALKLPLEFSHPERHKNLNSMQMDFSSKGYEFRIFNGFHTNTVQSLNTLLLQASRFSLYVSPHYHDDTWTHIPLGKPSIILSFLNAFQLLQEEYFFKPATSPDCLVFVEDDVLLFSDINTLTSLKKQCVRMTSDFNKKKLNYLVTRFADWNAVNLYDFDRLSELAENFKNATLTNPFDDMTQKHRLFVKRNEKEDFSFKKLKLKSTLTSQEYVSIQEWNKCIRKLQDSNVEETQKDSDSLLCWLHLKEKNPGLIKRPPGSTIRSPYDKYR